ncbi:unnamed protein product [Protopolystoma xenopodis]|uniref:Uncharacterized protein n=1 Tax=Protopolystoma xenopodis TaxID=117903 RepID=A0A3S5CDM5_9PLAT|nr:unnamed protein product [Protopolystoma xenopodis]
MDLWQPSRRVVGTFQQQRLKYEQLLQAIKTRLGDDYDRWCQTHRQANLPPSSSRNSESRGSSLLKSTFARFGFSNSKCSISSKNQSGLRHGLDFSGNSSFSSPDGVGTTKHQDSDSSNSLKSSSPVVSSSRKKVKRKRFNLRFPSDSASSCSSHSSSSNLGEESREVKKRKHKRRRSEAVQNYREALAAIGGSKLSTSTARFSYLWRNLSSRALYQDVLSRCSVYSDATPSSRRCGHSTGILVDVYSKPSALGIDKSWLDADDQPDKQKSSTTLCSTVKLNNVPKAVHRHPIPPLFENIRRKSRTIHSLPSRTRQTVSSRTPLCRHMFSLSNLV